MADIILHQYARSPFSEKVRIAMGIKGAAWKAVEIPSMMPKPDLMPLTGGYRKTPVMQVGADVYCDSACIIDALDALADGPSLYPNGSRGIAKGLSFWCDRPLFWTAVPLVFAEMGDKLPAAFVEDRKKFSGRDLDPAKLKAAQPAMMDQFRGHMAFLESMLEAGPYLLGAAPSAADCAAYNAVWFVRNGLGADSHAFAGFPKLAAWAERMAAFGHGSRTDIEGKDALAIARDAAPAPMNGLVEAGDPQGRTTGMAVVVAADDSGRDPVSGILLRLDAEGVAIRREDPQVGTVHQHFPRTGFTVTAA